MRPAAVGPSFLICRVAAGVTLTVQAKLGVELGEGQGRFTGLPVPDQGPFGGRQIFGVQEVILDRLAHVAVRRSSGPVGERLQANVGFAWKTDCGLLGAHALLQNGLPSPERQ